MKKSLLVKLSLIILMAFIMTLSTTLYIFRTQMIENAKGKAYAISELAKDTLTSYMAMGAMDKTQEFLSKVREIEGIEEIRVIGGKKAIDQLEGFEVPRDEIERIVL
ncbi:MAG: hypothetical protein ACK4LA_05680, partial [Aquificaceae bacterium]